MKGRIPKGLVFHGFFKNGNSEISDNDTSNLFTRMRQWNFHRGSEKALIQYTTLQPLSTPYPYQSTPYLNQFTFIEREDAKETEDLPVESSWFFVDSVALVRTDSDAAPLMGDIAVTWKERITATTTNGAGLFPPRDPWTGKSMSARNTSTAVRLVGHSGARFPMTSFLDGAMINGDTYPIGSPQSSLDHKGLIVPSKIPNPKRELLENYPGYLFQGDAVNELMREEISMKGVLVGYRPYFLLNHQSKNDGQPQAKHNHYNGAAKFQSIKEGMTNTAVPYNNIEIGITSDGLGYSNYDTINYSWINAWQQETANISLFKIEGTGLMRYLYELPDISFVGPSRKLDMYALEEGYTLNAVKGLEAIEELVSFFTKGGLMLGGKIPVVSGLISLFKDATAYTKDLMFEEARKTDMAKIYSSEPLNTHFNTGNSTTKTSNTYFEMGFSYPQPQLVGAADNDMYIEESQSQVSIPVNKLFRSLEDFSEYLYEHNLQDVSAVSYKPFMDGYDEKWDVMERFGFRRTEHLAIAKPNGDFNKDKRSAATDGFKRIGSQFPPRRW